MRLLRYFVVVNACAVMPLWWMFFGWMPDQVKVKVKASDPIALVADGAVLQGEALDHCKGETVWRFYLREGIRWKDLILRLPSGKNGQDVDWVKLEKWKLLSLEKSGGGLERHGGGTNEFVFTNPRFESMGFTQGMIPLGLAGGEVLLFGMSCWLAKRHREESWKTLWPSVFGVAFAWALLLQVVLPVQSFLADQSVFPFTREELGRAVACHFFVTLILWGIMLGLLTKCLGRWVLSCALAFSICAYLESGILSAGLPSLNGDWSYYCFEQSRTIWDFAVWAGVFAVVLGVHRWLKPFLGVAGWCVAGLSVASLLDVTPKEIIDRSNFLLNDFSSIETVVRSTTYSTNSNVMVFIIDSLEREQAHAIMEDPEAGPELREKFRGFTEYVDNVGAYSESLPSVANLMTGLNPVDSAGLAHFFASVYSEDSALKEYLGKQYAVYVATEALGYGYTNRRQANGVKREKADISRMRLEDDLGWNLQEICRFRVAPFGAKRVVAALTEIKMPLSEKWSDESTICKVLSHAEEIKDAPGVFCLFHTHGVHGPITKDRNGEYLAYPDNSDQGCIEEGIWVLRQLGSLWDALRDRGVYDSSLILVLADHGNHWHRDDGEDGIPREGCPFLWIKARGSNHVFAANNAPTWHANVAGLLKAASQRDLTEDEIQMMLSANVRIYRHIPDFSGIIRVWELDPNGQCITKSDLLAAGEPSVLRPGQRLSLERKDFSRNVDHIGFHHVDIWPSPVFRPHYKDMALTFRVPDPNKTYTLRMGLKMTREKDVPMDLPESCICFHQQDNCASQTSVLPTYRTEAVLHKIHANEEGFVTIVGQRQGGLYSNVYFLNLLVDEGN